VLHTLLIKSSCRNSSLGKRLLADFSSETLRFVRRVHGKYLPHTLVQRLRDVPPDFLMKVETFNNKASHAARYKPQKTAAARIKMTAWRDETAPSVGLRKKRHAKFWIKKTLCFDGYSTATYFEKRRTAFMKKHLGVREGFVAYSEELVVPEFKDYGIWSKPRNILIGSIPYLIFTIAGLSWFYRGFVELATTPFEIHVVKMLSCNEREQGKGSKGWRMVRSTLVYLASMLLCLF